MYKNTAFRSVRTFATKDNSQFMSDLLARVEKINLSKDSYTKPQKQAKKQVSKKPKTESSTTQAKPAGSREAAPSTIKRVKVQVAQHPLASERLNKANLENSKGPIRINRRRAQPSDRPRQASDKPSGKRPERPSGKSSKFSKTSKPAQKANPSEVKLLSKDVKPSDFKPSLTNHFLYGKATNFQINLTSRITSLVKSQLVNSKYPYKLPKHVIEAAPAEASNPFLLSSSSYSLELDEEKIKHEFSTIVKGKPEHIAGNSPVEHALNKNPTLSMAQKSLVVELAKSKSLKNLFKDAHWKL